jgi:hypothetical protein
MPHKFYGRVPQEQVIFLVDEPLMHQAEKLIAFCEKCDEESAEFPFDLLLDQVTGADPSVDYLLAAPAKCQNCYGEVFEKTLIAPHSL